MKARRGIFVGAAIIVTLAAVLALELPHISRRVQQSTHPLKYRDTVETIAAEYDVPPAIVLAVIKTESSFDPKAI